MYEGCKMDVRWMYERRMYDVQRRSPSGWRGFCIGFGVGLANSIIHLEDLSADEADLSFEIVFIRKRGITHLCAVVIDCIRRIVE